MKKREAESKEKVKTSRTGLQMMTGTIRIFFAEALILPTGFITAVFLARSLGPIDYGLFALASRLINWIELIGTSVFSSTTIKFVAEEPDWHAVGTTVVRVHLIMGGSIALLLWLLSSPLSLLFNEPAMDGYLKLFAIDIPLFCLACANGNILMGLGRFRERARMRAGRWIARFVLIILFVEMGLSVRGAIMGSIGASIAELVISGLYIRPHLISESAFPIRRLWGFAAPLFMSATSLRIFKLDLFALKALGGTAAHAGFFGAALNLASPMTLISQSLWPPLLSTLTQMLAEGNEAGAKEIGRTVIRSVLWTVPFAAMIAGTASEIADFIFGREFLPTGPILSLLVFSVIGMFTIKISNAILTALGKPAWTFMVTGPMVPLALIGHLILVPRMDAIGAAIVTTSVACFMGFFSIIAVYRIWGIFPPVKTVLKSIFCSVLAFGLAVLWPTSGLMLILKLIVIPLIILLTFFLLGEFTAREIALVQKVLRDKVKG